MQGRFVSARGAAAEEAFGLRQYAVIEGDVVVSGSTFVYGDDIMVMNAKPAESVMIWGYLKDMLKRWYYIEAAAGARYRLRFGSTGLVATTTEGAEPEGISAVTDTPIIQVSSSRAMHIFGMQPQCGVALPTGTVPYYRAQPIIGVPGCLINDGHKSEATQGPAGYTSYVAVGGVPVYVSLTYQSPFIATSQPQTPTPCYLYFQAAGLTHPAISGPRVRLGDLSNLTTPVSVTFMINHPVSEVGIFFPFAEEPADPLAAPTYSVIDITVATLLEARRLPLSGGGTDMPPGLLRPCLPGNGFAMAERSTSV